MKKEAIVTKIGEFTDFNGNVRKYVIAAVSEVVDNAMAVMDDDQLTKFWYNKFESDKDGVIVNDDINLVVKKLSIGFSICNVGDEFNEELGKTIAIGKARKKPTGVLYANRLGLINTKMVEAIVEQEMTFFENNPGSIITAYDAAKAKKLAK